MEACECRGEPARRNDKELAKNYLSFSMIKNFVSKQFFAETTMHIIKHIEETYNYVKLNRVEASLWP